MDVIREDKCHVKTVHCAHSVTVSFSLATQKVKTDFVLSNVVEASLAVKAKHKELDIEDYLLV